MNLKNSECIKVCALYIGTIIGAGFATGREIILFFGNQSVFVAILAGLCLGGVCGLFLMLGNLSSTLRIKHNIYFAKVVTVVNKILECLVFVCACISFCCMCSGAEYIINGCFSIKNFGLVLGLIVAVLSVFDLKFAKNLNFIVVPIIITLIIVLLVFCQFDSSGKDNILMGLKYCCMNLLMGGYIVTEQGKSMTKKQIAKTTIITAVIFVFLITAIYYVSKQYPDAYMPIFCFAQSLHLEIVAALIIIFSIFTTMLSCGNVIYKDIRYFIQNKAVSVCFLAVLTLLSFKWNFYNAVGKLYPIISYFGIVYFAIISTYASILQSKSSSYVELFSH